MKAFKKVKDLAPGATAQVSLKLDKYAVSHWNERISRWVAEKGTYRVRVGGGSTLEALVLEDTFEIEKTFEWNGL